MNPTQGRRVLIAVDTNVLLDLGGEVNDGLVLAESALLACSILLTSDEHLRAVDFERLTFELRSLGFAPPVIATPREIGRKFFR